MTKELIRLEDISFTYTGSAIPAVSQLSMTLNEGDRILLSGHNGSGKTTVLKLITGLLKASGGSITGYGKLILTEKDFHGLRTRTGLLFQNPEDQLFCASVEEDIAFGPFNLGWPRGKVKNAVSEILEKFGISGYEKKITSRLSGGEKRLVSLASVLVMEPDVLLLDEPSAGLDEYHTQKIKRLLSDWPRTILLISHDRTFAAGLTGSEIRLNAGKLE